MFIYKKKRKQSETLCVTSLQANRTDVSRTSVDNPILVFFLITVLVDNSVILHVNT